MSRDPGRFWTYWPPTVAATLTNSAMANWKKEKKKSNYDKTTMAEAACWRPTSKLAHRVRDTPPWRHTDTWVKPVRVRLSWNRPWNCDLPRIPIYCHHHNKTWPHCILKSIMNPLHSIAHYRGPTMFLICTWTLHQDSAKSIYVLPDFLHPNRRVIQCKGVPSCIKYKNDTLWLISFLLSFFIQEKWSRNGTSNFMSTVRMICGKSIFLALRHFFIYFAKLSFL